MAEPAVEILNDTGRSFLPPHDCLFKIIIIGSTGVGKSCVLSRLTENMFREEHDVTIGVEFGNFVLKMDDKVVKLQIWDTAGQESFRSITRIFYRGAHLVVCAYDITNTESFEEVRDWVREVDTNGDAGIIKVLMGNCKDLENERNV